MAPDPNSLLRSEPCAECGEAMLWTQNAWSHGESLAAAYRCVNGHVVDPQATRQCPLCGVHDTRPIEQVERGAAAFVCNLCGTRFGVGC
jgi:predicted RNA-binding Zn-ribbon protein involved in translation (DUF1610 family)